MLKCKNFFLIYGVLLSISSFAQTSGLGFELGSGFFIKHNPDILFDIERTLPFAEAKWYWQTNKRQSWARYHRFPRILCAARAQYLGIYETTGWSFAIYPSLDIPIKKGLLGISSFVIGSGLSYHTRFFDPVQNIRNNAIGSAWNNISRFQLKQSVHLPSMGTLAMALGFNHLSNGGTQSPNRGFNSWSFSMEWYPNYTSAKRSESNNKEVKAIKPWKYKRWYLDVQYSIGLREDKTPLGPKFYVHSIQTDLVYAIDPIQRWRVGLEWERNMQLVDFYSRQWQTENRTEAMRLGSSWSVYLADEFVFGSVSLTILLGYLFDSGYSGIPFYNKLAFRYYLPWGMDKNNDLYTTVVLKSRLATAEYIALGIGYRL